MNIWILLSIAALFSCGNTQTKNTEEKKIVDEKAIEPLDTFSYTGYNSVAYILAGKVPSDTLFMPQLIKSSSFQSHKSLMEKQWKDHKQKTDVMSDWSTTHIQNRDTVFYPFGGPDFNYMSAFFPDCRFSMLVGLEKGGKIPFSDSLSMASYPEILRMVSQSVASNLEFSFFRTNSMKRDLAGYLEGTLPIIMMFMSRHDFEIINVNPVFINNEGHFEYSDKENVYKHSLDKDFDDSYEIIYKKDGDDFYRKLYYFSMDLSDSALNKQAFSKMMDNYFKEQTTFLKAASYLLDRPQFKIMKEYILKYSAEIVSGPSGVQYRDLDDSWDIKLYGNYIGPITLFYDRHQNDMKEAYKTGNPEPIKFRFDYHPTHHSLIVAKKK
jgi:hypothetical protein